MPINLCVYAPIIGRGGVHLVVERMMKEFSLRDDVNVFILSQPHDELGKPIVWHCGYFEQIKPHMAPEIPAKYAMENQDVFAAHLKRFIKKHNIDVVWCPMPWHSVRSEKFNCSVPLVATIHDFGWAQGGSYNALIREESEIFRDIADVIVTPSDYQTQFARNRMHMDAQTIHWGAFVHEEISNVPNSQEDLDAYTRWLDDHLNISFSVNDHRVPDEYVLAFHTANADKNPETLLFGYARAKKQLGTKMPPLVIAGIESEWFDPRIKTTNHGAAQAQKLQLLMRNLGLQIDRDVYALGYVDVEDIIRLYVNCRVAVTTTKKEGGISGTMYEAMMLYAPLVYPDLEVFRPDMDGLGYVFESQNPKSLEAVLLRALESFDTDDDLKMRDRAEVFARSRSWRDCADKYIQLFKELT